MNDESHIDDDTRNITPTAQHPLRNEWKYFFIIIFRPSIIIPLLFAIISLIVGYLVNNPSLALILNIIACILTAVFGSIFYDTYKELRGDTLLIKKGKGAVRNLFLIVNKIQNISKRANTDKNIDEITNLVGLVEEDVKNSINEWADIIPAIESINIFDKKVSDTERAIESYRQKIAKLEIDNDTLAVEKHSLSSDVAELESRLSAATHALNRYKHARDSALAASTSMATISDASATIAYMPPSSVQDERFLGISLGQRCKKCGGPLYLDYSTKRETCPKCAAQG